MGGEWKQVKFRDVCTLIKRGISPKYVDTGGILVVNQKCIRDQRLSFNEARRNDFTIRNVSDDRLLRIGDVLINSTGVGTLGRVAQVRDLSESATIDSHVTLVRPNNERIDPPFFGWVVKNLQSYIESLGEGSTGQTELSRANIEEIEFSLPSFAEQRHIAHILSTLDDKIELNRQMNKTLEAMAQALFKSWFVDFDPVIDKAFAAGKEIPEALQEKAALRQSLDNQRKPLPPEIESLLPDEFVESELGWIPKGWESGTLAKLAKINPSEKIPKGIQAPFIDMKAIPQTGSCISYVTKKLFSSGSKFRCGDVLLARITPCLENGKTALVQCFHPNEIGHGSTEFIVLRPLYQRSSGLVYLIARNEVFREYCVNNMTGSSGRQRVAASQVAAYPMPIPPIAIVDHFSGMTADMFVKIGRLDKENQILVALRDTLLPKLISGEIRVPEAEDILAEAIHE